MPPRLSEGLWAVGGGLTPEWRSVARRRENQALAGLKKARQALAAAPASVRKIGFTKGFDYVLRAKGPALDRLVSHPCLDYWLHLFDKHFSAPAREHDWKLHFGMFQSFPAALALERGDTLELPAVLDPDGRFFFYGAPQYVEVPKGQAGDPITIKVGRGAISGGPLKRLTEVRPGLVVDDIGWLTTHGITMHGLLRLKDKEREPFAATIRQALLDLADRDPLLHEEISDLLRIVVPLTNPKTYGSVSSSYATLRGLIALSPSDDPLLQAETIIHEFCHLKMNQLLAVDAGLKPGQSGQVFYSPWRVDARRLRGLFLGAHAFLNVARYLARSLEREEYPQQRRIEVMVNVARRVEQVEDALRSMSFYGDFTDFGTRLLLEMWRELGAVRHAIQWFPPALLEQQRTFHRKHRAAHALGTTGLHRAEEMKDDVRRPPFTATQ